MGFFRLRELRDELLKKTNRSLKEEELLEELISMGKILGKNDFSLSLSSSVCKCCGRPFE